MSNIAYISFWKRRFETLTPPLQTMLQPLKKKYSTLYDCRHHCHFDNSSSIFAHGFQMIPYNDYVPCIAITV